MSQTYCTQCGAMLPEHGNFCPQCGAPAEKPDTAPPPAVTPSQAGAANIDPSERLAAELAEPATRPAETGGGSRTLLYALGGAAALVALLAVVYFAFLRPEASSGFAAADLSDCADDEPCTVEALTAAAQNDPDLPYPEVPRISVDDAHMRLASGTAVFLDVRDRDSFTNLHIPGAVWMPLDEVEARLGELPREAEILTYCT